MRAARSRRLSGDGVITGESQPDRVHGVVEFCACGRQWPCRFTTIRSRAESCGASLPSVSSAQSCSRWLPQSSRANSPPPRWHSVHAKTASGNSSNLFLIALMTYSAHRGRIRKKEQSRPERKRTARTIRTARPPWDRRGSHGARGCSTPR